MAKSTNLNKDKHLPLISYSTRNCMGVLSPHPVFRFVFGISPFLHKRQAALYFHNNIYNLKCKWRSERVRSWMLSVWPPLYCPLPFPGRFNLTFSRFVSEILLESIYQWNLGFFSLGIFTFFSSSSSSSTTANLNANLDRVRQWRYSVDGTATCQRVVHA